MGSIRSKKYKWVFEDEVKNNKHLFKVKIIKTFETRKDALNWEYKVQQHLNVVKSPLYYNMARANVNGMFGMDVKGKLNPNFGNRWSNETKQNLSKFQKEIQSENPRVWATLYLLDNPISKHIFVSDMESYLSQGWVLNKREMGVKNISKNSAEKCISRNSIKCCCLLCNKEVQAHMLENHIKNSHTLKIEFKGLWFYTFKDLHSKTGISKNMYEKWYLNGIDPYSKNRKHLLYRE